MEMREDVLASGHLQRKNKSLVQKVDIELLKIIQLFWFGCCLQWPYWWLCMFWPVNYKSHTHCQLFSKAEQIFSDWFPTFKAVISVSFESHHTETCLRYSISWTICCLFFFEIMLLQMQAAFAKLYHAWLFKFYGHSILGLYGGSAQSFWVTGSVIKKWQQEDKHSKHDEKDSAAVLFQFQMSQHPWTHQQKPLLKAVCVFCITTAKLSQKRKVFKYSL